MKSDHRLARTLLTAASLTACGATAFAHEGHGLGEGSHWHASDTLGLLLVGAVAAYFYWRSRGGK